MGERFRVSTMTVKRKTLCLRGAREARNWAVANQDLGPRLLCRADDSVKAALAASRGVRHRIIARRGLRRHVGQLGPGGISQCILGLHCISIPGRSDEVESEIGAD